jgi:GNAT superfamily N-acetyltransferase
LQTRKFLQRLAAALWNRARKLFSTTELCVYRLRPADQLTNESAEAGWRVNLWDDLCAFDEKSCWTTRAAFLREAEARITKGEQVHTVMKDGTLAHYGWLVAPAREQSISEVGALIQFPAHSAYAYDFYTHPHYRNTGLYQQSLRRIIAKLKRDGEIDGLYIAAVLQNRSSRSAIEKVGFSCFCSLLQSHRWGRARHWSILKDEHAGAAVECVQHTGGHHNERQSQEVCFKITPCR